MNRSKSNKPKLFSWVLCYSAGILVLLLCLILLGSSYFQSEVVAETSRDYPFVARTRIKGTGYPPIFAYSICGTSGESAQILRLLKAVYHPRNRYLLQLDADSSHQERRKLALSVKSDNIFQAFGNVHVVGSSDALDRTGSSALASTLHAAALFLKISPDWDWFITLSASDYPVVTQDDLLHAFTFLPRDLNFIQFSANTDRKQKPKINQIIVDPSLYSQKNTPKFYASQTRVKPQVFDIFQGSSGAILTRKFMQYCIHGWDNLPRTLLMYFTNVVDPLEFYFHTVLCNSPEFQNTSVNNNLRYLKWDAPLQVEPHFNLSRYKNMLESRTAFAGRFSEHDLVLQKLDEDILKRPPDGLVAGKWCFASASNQSAEESTATLDACTKWSNINKIKPGPYGLRLRNFLSKLAAEVKSRSSQCNRQ